MALELRPKKPKPGQSQKWVARFQISTGKRNGSGKLLYKNHAETIGERGPMTKKQAEKIYDRLKIKYKGGHVIDSPTLRDFSLEYIEHKRDVEKKKSWERDVYSLRTLINYFGPEKRLSDITAKDVDEFKAVRLKSNNKSTNKPCKPATVNRDIECLRHLINLATKWDRFEGYNPVAVAGTLQEIREEPVPVSFEEEDLLLPTLNPCIRRISEFALNTGMRIEEILFLPPKQINFNRLIVKIEATDQKGKRVREVPLNERALELVLESIEHGKKFHIKPPGVFLNTKGMPYAGHHSIHRELERACKRLGLRKIYPHLLRHTFITRAIESGGAVNPIALKEVVGHVDLKTLMRYVHLTESKFDAVNAVMRKKKDAK